MKGFKKMLLGFAFLFIALMGTIVYESDFGYVLFIIGAPLGILFCIWGCFNEEIKSLFKRLENNQGTENEK